MVFSSVIKTMKALSIAYWGVVTGLAGLAGMLWLDIARGSEQLSKQETSKPAAVEVEKPGISDPSLENKVTAENNKQEKKEITVPVIKGYEDAVFQRYDKVILEAREFWNNFFKNEKNYVEPPLGLVKRIMLVETCWGGKPTDEFYTDPMQVGKDFAYRVIVRKGREGMFPRKGVPGLKGKPLDAGMSIKCGMGWVIHKAIKYGYSDGKRLILSMDYSNAAERYNGGGDENYKAKFDSLEVAGK